MEETKKKASPKAKKASAQELVDNRERIVLTPKNREYRLIGTRSRTPRYWLQAQDRPGRGKNNRLLYFDGKRQRALRYVINFDSPFIDEQDSSGWDLAQEHILFERGVIGVDQHNISLQKFLECHPGNKKNGGNIFYEYDPEAVAKVEVDTLLIEVEAITAARDADIATMEAVLRPKLGTGIHEMKTDRLTRELLLFAKREPVAFLEAINDESIQLQNIVYTAIDFKILELTDGGLTLRWAMNNEKLLAIPFGNNPHKYVAEWFKSDEGLEILNKVTQKLQKQ